MAGRDARILDFANLTNADVAIVGGKNASLGELVRSLGAAAATTGGPIRVPAGFAICVRVYRAFVAANQLAALITDTMARRARGELSLAAAGHQIRQAFLAGHWPPDDEAAIRTAWATFAASQAAGAGAASATPGADAAMPDFTVAVRSSATAEDLPEASFAGQQDTWLNVVGIEGLLEACRGCFASLFNDRAIAYREAHGFDHLQVGLSVGVQRMVRSDIGGAGVMFSIDTDSGFDRIVLINATWGLGESLVQGSVDPDEYHVFKPLLETPGCTPIIERRLGAKATRLVFADGAATRSEPCPPAARERFVLDDADVLQLARWALAIERHYGRPMDIEWAKDGRTGELFIVQARPETVHGQTRDGDDPRLSGHFRLFHLQGGSQPIITGLAIGTAIASGPVCRIDDAADLGRFVPGAVLVTTTTDPDWGPILQQAAAIVTDHGGRTSHAAIVSRELGLPAVVGTGDATSRLVDGQLVTVSCAGGEIGAVHAGIIPFSIEEVALGELPATRTRIMLNLANPASTYRWWRLPVDGIGLARMEFVINEHVRIHPMALAHYDAVTDPAARTAIDALTRGYADRTDYFVERLARGLARIAALVHPRPAIVRMSDFKTNEYAHLLGGADFEPAEENPMLGFRGASRYYSPRYRDGFALECRAIRKLREEMGFRNVIVMIPFCRTLTEADQVLKTMAECGLARGAEGLEVYMMCEIPANVVLAEAFAERFDGFSIGSNDLTQLTLGVDRDAGDLADLFDEQDPAMTWMIQTAIAGAHARGIPIGLCGQAPSDHPGFAAQLVTMGIDSMSVSPDSFVTVKRHVAEAERQAGGSA